MFLTYIFWLSVFVSSAFTEVEYLTNSPVTIFGFNLFLLTQFISSWGIYFCLFILTVGTIKIVDKDSLKSVVAGTVQILALAFITSGIFLYLVAFTQLNILSVIYDIRPTFTGLITNTDQIVAEIDSGTKITSIVAGDQNGYQLIKSIAAYSTGKSHYYGRHILSSFPDILIKNINNPISDLNLIDGTLIFSDINQANLIKISPILAHQMIQDYFPDLTIKNQVTVSLMDSKSYTDFRVSELNNKRKSLSMEIIKLEEQASESADLVGIQQNAVEKLKNDLNDMYSQRETENQSCLAKGEYRQGIFLRTNSPQTCLDQYNSWEEKIISNLSGQDILIEAISQTRNNLSSSSVLIPYLKTQQTILNLLENNIPSEYGAFQPEANIGIAFIPQSTHIITDYFSTLIHEYLHYAGYHSSNRILSDSFFEEGLTEYFSRKIIAGKLGQIPNIGYPAITKIISQIALRVPESELAYIYFDKDQARLETVIDRVYGENFYKNNRILFISLQYSTNPEEIVKYANLIMEKIGGQPLTLADVNSSSTTL